MDYLSKQRYDEIATELKHLIGEVYPKIKGDVGSSGDAGYIRGRALNKMEKACEASLSCGQVVLYRTFLEDLEELYLSGF